MQPGNIKSFSVYGLFGTDDVHIPFDENIKILIGENGLGKTQVLNLFYYTLTRNFFRLGEFSFDRLTLEFHNCKPIIITKDDVKDLVNEVYNNPVIKDLIEEIGYSHFEFLRNRFIQSKGNRRKLEAEFEYNSKFRKYPIHHIIRVLEQLESNKSNKSNPLFSDCEKAIESGIKGSEIMYFPTYRQVEEDLHNLGYDNEDELLNQENTLIQFGMDDVLKRFNKIENTIDKLLKEGLAQFTKDILNVVIDEFEPVNNILEKINEDDIDIILSRVGTLLPKAQKESVKNIVAKKEFKNPLSAYLLQKLIDIYEKQKELDYSVKIFRDVCNKYLVKKEVFYDESVIKISIKSHKNGSEIALSKLSSGEKQIISMFSKIYLSESDKRFIVLFDEPELSLSITWQMQLLPDILNSKKCDFLLAVTHSPFIFDNELGKFAIGLDEYFEPTTQDIFL